MYPRCKQQQSLLPVVVFKPAGIKRQLLLFKLVNIDNATNDNVVNDGNYGEC
jgi:hypothetical protein